MDQGVPATLLRLFTEALPPGTRLDVETPLGAAGLDSLAAARVWLRIGEELGHEVPFRLLSGETTVAALAEWIDGRGTGTARGPVPVEPEAVHEPFALTPLQQSYLTGTYAELGDDPVGCHQYLEFEVPDLDPVRLVSAWRELIARHPMLRAVLTPDGRQRILPDSPDWPPTVHDLRPPTAGPAPPTAGPAPPTAGPAPPTAGPALPTAGPALPTAGPALPTAGPAL
ncbi:MAG: hypothetical protein GEV11_28370, partial [Streptosporangiales bacterium]|nr:hypothetical protein [Streptosporangiales bacterium]